MYICSKSLELESLHFYIDIDHFIGNPTGSGADLHTGNSIMYEARELRILVSNIRMPQGRRQRFPEKGAIFFQRKKQYVCKVCTSSSISQQCPYAHQKASLYPTTAATKAVAAPPTAPATAGSAAAAAPPAPADCRAAIIPPDAIATTPPPLATAAADIIDAATDPPTMPAAENPRAPTATGAPTAHATAPPATTAALFQGVACGERKAIIITRSGRCLDRDDTLYRMRRTCAGAAVSSKPTRTMNTTRLRESSIFLLWDAETAGTWPI